MFCHIVSTPHLPFPLPCSRFLSTTEWTLYISSHTLAHFDAPERAAHSSLCQTGTSIDLGRRGHAGYTWFSSTVRDKSDITDGMSWESSYVRHTCDAQSISTVSNFLHPVRSSGFPPSSNVTSALSHYLQCARVCERARVSACVIFKYACTTPRVLDDSALLCASTSPQGCSLACLNAARWVKKPECISTNGGLVSLNAWRCTWFWHRRVFATQADIQ